jgi:SHS2 domain-containing protein
MKDKNYNAFIWALAMTITAPDGKVKECLEVAEAIGNDLTLLEKARAKKIIEKAIENNTLEDILYESKKKACN